MSRALAARSLTAVLLSVSAAPASAEPHVAALAGTVAYRATFADDVVLCTEMTYDSGPYAGRTRYWSPDASLPPGGRWVDGPVTPYGCVAHLSLEPNEPECPVLLAVDEVAGTPLAAVWQDCEPYEPFRVDTERESAGRLCHLGTVADVTREAGTYVGVVDAGPVAFTTGGGTLRCAVYVNGTFAVAVSAHTV